MDLYGQPTWPIVLKPDIKQKFNHWATRGRLTLKTALANISAATNTRKQSTVAFKVFVLWLHNQCYYTCDVLGIKMTYKD